MLSGCKFEPVGWWFSMTDKELKNLLGFLLRNKDTAFSLLDNFKPEDIEKGLLAIPENAVNRDIRMLVLDKAAPYLNDYNLLFHQGAILADLDLNVKPLGRLKAKYMLTVTRFEFHDNTHQIQLSYKEDVKAGNIIQSMALKAVGGLKDSYLQSAAGMMNLDFVKIGKDHITIDLDALKFTGKIPPELSINFAGCENGTLKFKFHIS